MKPVTWWRCRIIATGKILNLRTYGFGFVDAKGDNYAKAHVTRLEKVE